MKILLSFLLLGTFCFGTTGYKDFSWGTSKSKIIAKYGKDYVANNNSIIYTKFNFDGVTLKMTFVFQDEKLFGWSGSGIVENEEGDKLIDQYRKKYNGKLEEIGSAYRYDDTKGIIAFGSQKLKTGRTMISFACEMK